tara:strand:- start:181 stop:321 length:141 start_codon:yes stop_codon:yes gene_type:complete
MEQNNLKWVEKLRVNSWEIEILIVACILAALFNPYTFLHLQVESII